MKKVYRYIVNNFIQEKRKIFYSFSDNIKVAISNYNKDKNNLVKIEGEEGFVNEVFKVPNNFDTVWGNKIY